MKFAERVQMMYGNRQKQFDASVKNACDAFEVQYKNLMAHVEHEQDTDYLAIVLRRAVEELEKHVQRVELKRTELEIFEDLDSWSKVDEKQG